MGSSRLPRKVLAGIGGRTMLSHVVRRATAAKTLQKVVVATSSEPADDVVEAWCQDNGVSFFRGSENDVLDRYYHAAYHYRAEAVTRITSDCPMIDPEIIDRTVSAFLDQRPDYASNTRARTYPRGLDTEVMTFAALQRAWSEARNPYQRIHVTPFIYENPEMFSILSVTGETDYSCYRWTVDTHEDLEFVRAVYARLGETFSYHDALGLIKREPKLAEINRFVTQKALHDC